MGFTVIIIAGPDKDSSSIQATGSTQHVITDTERVTFGITDSLLKDAIGKYLGKRPDDAFLHSPTPWDDLYKKYQLPQVTTIIQPTGAFITDLSSQPTVIGTNSQVNSSSVPATFSFGVTTSVTETTEDSWNVSNTISVSETTTFSFGSKAFASGSQSITFSYGRTWGTGGSQSNTTTVGATERISVKLQPGQSATASLTMNKGTLHAKIFWQARLTGMVAWNYSTPYKDHHFHWAPIEEILKVIPRENHYVSVEDISYGFYVNAHTVLQNS
jgi:hypothetical protein